MGLRMAGLEDGVEPVLLLIGDAGLVEDGDKLVFGDGYHGGSFCLMGARAAGLRGVTRALWGVKP